jgi:hypothetical protein
MLVRKASRIMKELKGPGSNEVVKPFQTLVNIMTMKKDFTNEIRSILEDFLSDVIRYQGVDCVGTAYAKSHLGHFHYLISDMSFCADEKRNYLQLVESYYKEVSRISAKYYGPNHPNTLQMFIIT